MGLSARKHNTVSLNYMLLRFNEISQNCQTFRTTTCQPHLLRKEIDFTDTLHGQFKAQFPHTSSRGKHLPEGGLFLSGVYFCPLITHQNVHEAPRGLENTLLMVFSSTLYLADYFISLEA